MEGLVTSNRRMLGSVLSHLDDSYLKLANNTSTLVDGRLFEKETHSGTAPEAPGLQSVSDTTEAGSRLVKVDAWQDELMFDPETGRTRTPWTVSPDDPIKEHASFHSPCQSHIEERPVSFASAVEVHQGLSTLEATFSMVNYLMNFGLFSVPAVFVMCGPDAVLLVAVTGAACVLTAVMLGRVLERLQVHGLPYATYRDIARAAAGPGVATFMGVTGTAEVTMYAVGNFIVLAHTLADLVEWLDFTTVMIASSVLTALLSAIPDKMYSYVSFLSALSLSMACATVVVSGCELPSWAEGAIAPGGLSRLPMGFSILIFGAAAHPVLPSLYGAAGSREVFERAAFNGWIAWAAVASSFGLGSWYMFGDSVKVIATRNIGFDLRGHPMPGAQGLAAFSACWLVLKLQGSQVPATRPLVEAFAKMIGVRLPKGNGGLRCMLASAPMIAVAAMLAFLLQTKIVDLEAMSGGFLMSINAFIFPAFAYVQICKPEGWASKLCSAAAASLGVALFALTCGLAGR